MQMGNELKTVSVRLVQDAPLISRNAIREPKDAIEVIGKEMRTLDREAICIVNLDTQKRPVSCSFISLGTVDAAVTSPREVFKQALLSNASSIIMMHNHPCGNPRPSDDDIRITQVISDSGNIMGIPVIDHVIVGEDTYFSFREHGFMNNLEFCLSMTAGNWTQQTSSFVMPYSVNDNVREITEKLEQGVKDLFKSKNYKDYLNTMSRFYNYSAANCLLISLQKPDATHVAGLRAWNQKFGRSVNKGESAIRILSPCPYAYEREVIRKDASGKLRSEKELVEGTRFRISYVFDVSQTSGKPLPEIVHSLEGSYADYEIMINALKDISPVPVEEKEMHGGVKGYYDLTNKKIVISDNISEQQNVKTLIHEIVHAKLHDNDTGLEKDDLPERNVKEVEAESIAYTVSKHFGLDTSEYSFGYIAGWSSDMNMSELKHSMSIIRDTSAELIEGISERLEIPLDRKIDNAMDIHEAVRPNVARV